MIGFICVVEVFWQYSTRDMQSIVIPSKTTADFMDNLFMVYLLFSSVNYIDYGQLMCCELKSYLISR